MASRRRLRSGPRPLPPSSGLFVPFSQVAILLGLMFKYSCEECRLVIFDPEVGCGEISNLSDQAILKNMQTVLATSPDSLPPLCRPNPSSDNKEGPTAHVGVQNRGFPLEFLLSCLQQRKRIDNLVVLGSNLVGPGGEDYSEVKSSHASSLFSFFLALPSVPCVSTFGRGLE